MSEAIVPIRRALMSVFDKRGLVELARFLAAEGVELLASGGTRAALCVDGLAVTEVLEGLRRFPVVMRFPAALRADAGAIGSLLLTAPGGERVPLHRVADIREPGLHAGKVRRADEAARLSCPCRPAGGAARKRRGRPGWSRPACRRSR